MKNFCVVLFIIWFAGPACGSKGGGGGTGGGTGGGGMTNPTPAPSISSINPTSGTAGGGTAVTITGSNFGSTATVTIGSVALTNVSVSGNTITGTTGQSSTAGAMNVNVSTAGQSASLSNGFTYTAVLRALINGAANGSIEINHNDPKTFSATQSSTTNPYTINSYSWNCGQDPTVYGTPTGAGPCIVQSPPNPTPIFSYRHCASTTNPPRQPCTSGSGDTGRRTYTMTLTVTDTQGNSNSTNFNVTVKNQY